MLMEALRGLRQAGISVGVREPVSAPGDGGADAILAVGAGVAEACFAVEERGRAPYPNELVGLQVRRDALSHEAQPLLVVPFVPEPLGTALTAAGWSWADAQGNFDLRGPGLMLRQRRTAQAPKPTTRRLPRGSGSLAIVRALIRFAPDDDELGATSLAARANVSQPRASQVLARLRDLGLMERSKDGRWRPHREALLDRFLAEYRGPGGSERYFYSLDAPAEVALRAAQSEGMVAVSADVGPDLLAPWRRPSVAILYTDRPLNEEALRLVEAQGPHDANVIVREPADRSVFRDRPLVVQVGEVDVRLTDESQLLWDLQELGGVDRLEAAGRLREWLLRRR